MAEEFSGFDDILHALDSGAAIVDANRLQRELIARLREVADDHGTAKGSITLKLTYDAEKKGSVQIGYSIKTDPPKMPTRRTTLYTTSKGTLVDEDPRQSRLPMRDVPSKGGVS